MAIMIGGSRASVWMIDVLCGFVLAACVGAFLWVTAVRSDETLAEIARLEQVVEQARHNLAKSKAIGDKQRTTLINRSEELGRTGQLPARSPVVEYMQTVSKLARDHDLKLIRHHPAASRTYAGLFEARIECELSGSLPNLVRFFAAIEVTTYWADIGYLKVAQRPGAAPEVNDARMALLTFSLFSALPSEADSESG